MEVEGEKIRILLIEDNPGDARLIRELLAEGDGASFDLEYVDCLSKGLTRLAQRGVDIVLLDLTLPDSHDLDGLGKILAQTLEVPIVVLSGVSDERVTIKAVRDGAQDYLVKGEIDSNRLVRSIRYAIERQRLRVALHESEALYRLLANNIADVIWTADAEARITYVSPSIKRVLGYTVEETMKLKISDILTPDSTEQARRFVKWQMKTFARGVQYPPASMTLEHVRKDGSTVWAEVMLSFMQDKNGNVTGIMGATRDITERRKAEEALRESEEKYRQHFENVSDVIFSYDREFRILSMSPSVKRMLGYSPEELIGKRFTDLNILAPECLELALSNALHTLEGERVTTGEYIFITKDGSRRYGELSPASPLVADGKVVAVLSVGRDITERKQIEEALRQSEERYRELVEKANDIIYTHDMAGNFTSINKAGEQVIGYMRDEILGMNISQILTPESLELARKMTSRKVNPGGSTQYEIEIAAKDGHRVLLEVSTRLILEGDKPVSVQGIARDITKRKDMERELRQREQGYLILLESTHDSIIVVDAETLKVVFGNRRFALMFGFDPVLHDAVGVNLLDFIYPEDREIAIKGFAEDLYQRERRQRYDVRAKTKDSREIWVSALATRIEFQGRVAVLLSLRDVTKEKRMEEERQKLEEELLLAGRLAAVGELAAGVAHELNNPLAAIQGFAQLFTSRNDLDETMKNDLGIVYREAQRAAKITQNLLSFARRHEPEKHLISINEVIQKTLEMHAHQMKVNNIEPVVDFAADQPKTMADFFQMQQVFVNIIINAEQAMIEAHGRGRLLVETQWVDGVIQITFTDDGPGIPKENLERIFDPFFTTKEIGKGTGLGLSVCYGIIQAHGGRIYARSKPGEGAAFVVEIPIISEGQ